MTVMTDDILNDMEESIALYRQLKRVMELVEKKLSLLDLVTTVEAANELDRLHREIVAMDNRILSRVTPENAGDISGRMEERRALIAAILEQNRILMPKLKTRLAGYRDELLKIRGGRVSMQGYQQCAARRQGRINTVN